MTTIDDTVQMTYLAPDDLAHRRELRQKRAERAQRNRLAREPPPLPNGSCCGRCRHWRQSRDEDDAGIGFCRYAAVVKERVRTMDGNIEKGTVVTIDELARLAIPAWEPLRTRPWFAGCTGFVGPENEDAA